MLPVSAAFAGQASTPLKTLDYAAVQLGDGRMRDQFRHQHALFRDFDNDKLLKPFRSRAGLPAPGADMGGWYDDSRDFHVDPNDWSTLNWHGYIPGHSFGQYVSGLARSYAVTGDAATKEKVRALVVGYIPTIGPKFFEGYYLPAYTYDKLAIGLIDAYRYAGVAEAKDALDTLTDAVLPFLPEKALTREERRQRPYTSEAEIWDEPYTLPENLFIAWASGMGERYKGLAVKYLQNEALFDPLAAGKSPFKGKHAYSHVNAMNSAVQAYYATGDDTYLKAAKNGFAFIEAQSYATGGWGPNEELVAADDTETLYRLLSETHRSFETPCGVYGHFKIARSLLSITRDSRYGDSMERVLYNGILGAKDTQANGDTFYYSDYNQKATKVFRGEPWPCCSGTFIQLTADYGISAYLTEPRALYVNLYVPSQLKAQIAGQAVAISQTTNYPLEATTRISVDPARAAKFAVMLRIPAWAGPKTAVRINGKPWAGALTPGTFLAVDRTWKKGDVVEIAFDMGLRLEPLNAAHPEMVAVVTGPLVLMPIEETETQLRRDDWLKAVRSGPDNWTVKTASAEVKLKPFMAIGAETYRLYNRLLT
ncbi:beta-L-arabinofuranosidase domain-containing protein [Asticcacaulis solisilvae]|uniref:beta-L-arabinofuranosidase domain-containing protein n=1 Tax=Asticcacaulis solisilvae TaxID=1217274 RepID=UPI003FD7D81A